MDTQITSGNTWGGQSTKSKTDDRKRIPTKQLQAK